MNKSIPSRAFTSKSGAKLEFSAIGLGTAVLGNLYQAQSEATAAEAIHTAYDEGVRYFDTAPQYGFGLSERRLGTGLREMNREDVLLSTKAGRILKAVPPSESESGDKWIDVPSRKCVYDYSYDGCMRSIEFSLERLGVDYIDILLCHDLDASTHGTDEYLRQFLGTSGGYKAFDELRSSGVVKAIGLGVNEWQVCEKFALETDMDLFLLAGRFTLLEQESLDSFLPICEKRGMGVIIGGPFNSGILASGAVKGAYFNYDIAPPEIMERVRKIEAVCNAHNVRLKDVAVQFPLLHPSVVSVIPGGANAVQITENIRAISIDIPSGLWSDLKTAGLMHPDFIPVK